MKPITSFTKRDIIVTLACAVFLLANLAAIEPRGRRHAKDILCLSNLHKWGTVFQAFLEDNNGRFMTGYQDSPGLQDYWMQALRPYYANNHRVRCCPEAAVPGTEIGLSEWGGHGTFVAWGVFTDAWWAVVPGDYGSYGNNAWTCDLPPDAIFSPFDINNWRTPNVAGANHIPLLGDHPWLDCWPNSYDDPPEYDGQPWPETSQMGRVCINRHQGFVNWVFLDFSARKVGLKELWTLKWHRRYDTCDLWTICGGVTGGDWPVWMQNFPDY